MYTTVVQCSEVQGAGSTQGSSQHNLENPFYSFDFTVKYSAVQCSAMHRCVL